MSKDIAYKEKQGQPMVPDITHSETNASEGNRLLSNSDMNE